MTRDISESELIELERKARSATPGPWKWFGNTKMHEVYLATVNRGRIFVMDFVRWGMRGAQPRFQVRLDGTDGVMRTLGELGATGHPLGPRFEASHRRQFSGIGHPDAEHIAANSPDITIKLIARIRELEGHVRAAAEIMAESGLTLEAQEMLEGALP